MPIGIGVHGGLLRETALENVSSDEALKSLQQIRGHLSQPGRDTGVLTLFNRTSTGSEMTLERKSGLQLLFQKEERLDDTVHALRTLLGQAGKDEAVAELDEYLSHQGGRQNRIESSRMFEILNRHLPPLEKGSSIANLCTLAKIEVTRELGRGSFGKAFLVSANGGECVLKQFDKPQVLSLSRTAQKTEAIASYLAPKNDQGFLSEKVSITQPTYYMVSVPKEGRQEYQMVTGHAMRSLVKEAAKSGSEVLCHGLVMPKAKGQEVQKLISEGTLTGSQKKQIIGSTLLSIKGLNERGFVHRDIKSANTFFDGKSETSTFIDTGLLFKASKNQDKHPGTEYIEHDVSGTPAFMHPRAFRGERHGTEADLYALGVMALEVDHPVAFDHLRIEITLENLDSNGITEAWLRAHLDAEIETTDAPRLKSALIALRDDLGDPTKLAGFAMTCFEKAGLPAEEWKERAQQIYAELLGHPGLQ